MTAPAPALEARALVKWYGPHPALRGLDLTVAPGEIVALFGPNGAGKTTLLRLLAGRVRPTSGTVVVAGHPVDQNGARAVLGVLAHGHQCYEALTARENLAFAAAMLGRRAADPQIQAVLAQVGLEAAAALRVRTFSAGMKRRLALAVLLLRAPQILLLDEPYASLDAAAMKLLEAVLLEAKATGASALLATHNLPRGLDLADRVVILRRGRVIYEARREETSLETVRALVALEEEGGE